MISTSGLPASLAITLISQKRETFETSIKKEHMNAREISAFQERISKITTVDQLVEDYEVYSFAMKAYDLEDQMFGKAMMKKLLSSDIDDKKSLINKMTDSRFKEIHKAFGFTQDGKANPNTSDPDWAAGIVQRYVDQKLINDQLDNNSIVGHVLHFQLKSNSISNWYNVLADTKLQEFFMTAYSLSDELKNADIDAQAKTLAKKIDIETLKDPEVQEKLIKRYSAMAQAAEAQKNIASNPIVQLLSNIGSSTQRSITAINLDGLSTLKGGKY